MESKYLIWSIEHDAWWPISRCGYVYNLSEAGRFDKQVAEEIVKNANIVSFNECMIPEWRCRYA